MTKEDKGMDKNKVRTAWDVLKERTGTVKAPADWSSKGWMEGHNDK